MSFSTALMNELNSIICEIVSLRPTTLLEAIVYGDKKLNDKLNHRILNQIPTINCIKSTQRFEQSLS